MHNSENILIIGGDGFIGKALTESLKEKKTNVISTTKKNVTCKNYLNLADSEKKWVIPDNIESAIICAGITKLEFCENDNKYSHFINVEQIKKLINLLLQKNVFILYLSSNQVFNGEKINTLSNEKYSPVNNYGKQKVEVEKYIGENSGKLCILRLSKVFDESFALFHEWVNRLRKGQAITVFDDLYVAPLYLGKVISVIESIVLKKQIGILQFSAGKDISYYEIMKSICDEYGFNKNLIKRESYKSRINFNLPKYSTLNSSLIYELFGFDRPNTEKTIKKLFSNIV